MFFFFFVLVHDNFWSHCTVNSSNNTEILSYTVQNMKLTWILVCCSIFQFVLSFHWSKPRLGWKCVSAGVCSIWMCVYVCFRESGLFKTGATPTQFPAQIKLWGGDKHTLTSCVLCWLSIAIMVFILYKLYILSP